MNMCAQPYFCIGSWYHTTQLEDSVILCYYNRFHWWKWYYKASEIYISPNMEGLSLGGCTQCFVTFAWKGLGSLQVLCLARTGALLLGCTGDGHTGYIQSFLFWTWGLSTGRMGDEGKYNIPSTICNESCLGKQLPQLASAPWPRMCSLPFPMGWLGCSVRPSVFFSTETHLAHNVFPFSSMISL